LIRLFKFAKNDGLQALADLLQFDFLVLQHLT
jgi:hypothetical protein